MVTRAQFGTVCIVFASVIGCHSGEEHGPGTRCDDHSPCRSPLVCIQGSCEPTDSAATNGDVSIGARDDANDGGAVWTDGGDATIDGSSHPPTDGKGADGSDAPTDGSDAPTDRATAIDAGDDATDAEDASIDSPVDRSADAIDGGNDDGNDGGGGSVMPVPPPPGICTRSAVSSACREPAGRPGCAEIFCGGRLWQNGVESYGGLITYRIDDPKGEFSDAYKNAIRAGAQAWSDASEGLVRFRECPTCWGRVVVVVPGTGDGITDPTQVEQVLPIPVKAGASPPLHVIAHQWGHAIGLGHTYERADRDRYVRFDPKVWCGPQRSGVPPRCALGPDQPGIPRVASDTFGVYDEQSKMNGFEIDGVCGSGQPDSTSGLPTEWDGSAVQELYLSHTGRWAPFQPIARSVSPTQPLDYQLAPGVDPVGSPAITEWTAPAVEIFVRGTDDKVYEVHNELFGTVFQRWSPWTEVAADVDADPAAVFSDPDTLHLVVRARSDGSIRMRTRTKGTWGAQVSLGAPAVGAASAPAIAAYNGSLSVVVRGTDGLLYVLTCAPISCTADASQPDAWSPVLAPVVVGKPSAAFLSDGRLVMTGVAADGTVLLIVSPDATRIGLYASAWDGLPQVTVMPGDPDPGVAILGSGGAVIFYARGPRGRLINAGRWDLAFNLGGILASTPAATLDHTESWVHIAAVIEDHGRPGVWVKFYGQNGFTPPCNYNAPGTCAQCGCNLPGKLSCEL